MYDAFNLNKEDIDKFIKIIDLKKCHVCNESNSYTAVYDDDMKIVFMNSDFSTYNKLKGEFSFLSNSYHVPIVCTNCGHSNLFTSIIIAKKLNEAEV